MKIELQKIVKKNILAIFFLVFTLINCNGQSQKIKEQHHEKGNTFSKPEGFYVLDSVDLDLKRKKIKIIVLESDLKKTIENVQHNSNSIFILLYNGKGYKMISENKTIVLKYDENCPADGFGGLVEKNNYFTVQQIFCSDFLFVNSYTTFKIDENADSVILHKYGEEYTDRSNPDKKIPAKIWTKKDFGEVKFENVTEDFLLKIRSKKPL